MVSLEKETDNVLQLYLDLVMVQKKIHKMSGEVFLFEKLPTNKSTMKLIYQYKKQLEKAMKHCDKPKADLMRLKSIMESKKY